MKKLGFLGISVVIWFVCAGNPYACDRFSQQQLSQVPPVRVIYPESEFSKGLSYEIRWSPVGADGVEYQVLVFDRTTGVAPPTCKYWVNNEGSDFFEITHNYYSRNEKKGFENEGL